MSQPQPHHSHSQSFAHSPAQRTSTSAIQPSGSGASPSSTAARSKPRPHSTAASSLLASAQGGSSNLSSPAPPASIHASAIVAEKAYLVGSNEIVVGAGAVIHPFARLDATYGKVVIGEGAVVWERAHIGAEPAESSNRGAGGGAAGFNDGMGFEAGGREVLTELGAHCMVEAAAVVEQGARLGEHCIVEVAARVGAGSVLGDWTRLAPCISLARRTRTQKFEVWYWRDNKMEQRVNVTARDNEDVMELQKLGNLRHVDLLRRLVKGNNAKWSKTGSSSSQQTDEKREKRRESRAPP